MYFDAPQAMSAAEPKKDWRLPKLVPTITAIFPEARTGKEAVTLAAVVTLVTVGDAWPRIKLAENRCNIIKFGK
jgi:hypothetical protein